MAYQPYNYSAQDYAPVPYQSYQAVQPVVPPDYGTYYGIPPGQAPEPASQQQPQQPPIHIQTVNAQAASQSMRRLISSELRNAGFKKYESATLSKLENEVTAFMEILYRHAKEYTTLCNRVTPTPHDLLAACEDRGMNVTELRLASKKRKRKRAVITPTRLISPPPREPSPDLLPSDDEDAPVTPVQSVTLPQTLQDLPDHLPSLPPKHTYLHTAPAVLKKSKIPSLDKKLDNAAKVQQSLRNLVKATEESTGKGDLELASGIVNWMATANTGRKRWKIR